MLQYIGGTGELLSAFTSVGAELENSSLSSSSLNRSSSLTSAFISGFAVASTISWSHPLPFKVSCALNESSVRMLVLGTPFGETGGDTECGIVYGALS